MAAEIVIGLFQSRGIAEDAVNRLRTEGVLDRDVSLKMLRDTTDVPVAMEPELAALSVDPMVWGNVRDTYVDYIHNGETVVMVRAMTDDDIQLTINVLRMFEPLVVELLVPQTVPLARKAAISSAE